MSKLEKFGLVTGIIGLVADCIALLVFLSGIWTPTSPKTTPGQMPPIYQALLALTITYGWLSTSWTITRRSFLQRKDRSAQRLITTAFGATVGIGLLVLPLAAAWWASFARGWAIQQQAEIDRRRTIQATQTIQALSFTPTPTSDSETSPQPTPTRRTLERDSVDTSATICAVLPVHLVLATVIFLVLVILMPIIYTDTPTLEDVLVTLAALDFRDLSRDTRL